MSANGRTRAAGAPPIRGRTSILPAAAVLLLAVGTLLTFLVLNVVLGSGSTTPTTLPVILGGLRDAPHTPVFFGWVGGGEPPANVASGLIAPVGATRVGTVQTGGAGAGSSDYDLEVRVRVDAPRARLLGFYRTDLEALGWALISSTGSGPHAQLLFQREGGDGFYWEAGVDATTTAPAVTTYTYRLFQAADYG